MSLLGVTVARNLMVSRETHCRDALCGIAGGGGTAGAAFEWHPSFLMGHVGCWAVSRSLQPCPEQPESQVCF
jgi:hypothetical protein